MIFFIAFHPMKRSIYESNFDVQNECCQLFMLSNFKIYKNILESQGSEIQFL